MPHGKFFILHLIIFVIMKSIFRKLHLWLSLPFGVLIALICFSGAMLVFEQEITMWARPDLYRVERLSGPMLTQEEAAAKVAATLPDGVKVKGVTAYPDPERSYQVNLSKPKRAAVFVNPYTGEVLGKYERLPFFRTMFGLHRWLLGSRPDGGGIFLGKMIVGVSTLLFVIVLLSGIIIWWPRTKKALTSSLKITVRKGWRRFWYSLHVAGGMYALLLLLIMALTGLTWSFGWYREWFYEFFGVDKRWVYGVHVGSFGGMITRILWFLAALLGATLPLTGYYLWWKRIRRRR
jgi:uncharacterized iron-regulated membrane protein